MTLSHDGSALEQPEVVVGIDIGGTGTRLVAWSTAGELVGRRTVATPTEADAEHASSVLRSQIDAVLDGRRLTAVGIGASGPIDATGVIRNPDTLPAFTGIPLVADLASQLGVPVSIDNDAVCAAIAELKVGAGRGAEDLLHVTLGTGIGVAYLVNGKPVRGRDGAHPEAGHIAVSTPTPACYCGRRGCWEQGASRLALQKSAASLLGLQADDRTAIASLAARADAGDATARAAFDSYGVALADGLATLLAVHRATTVVLGGSAAMHFHQYEATVNAELATLGGWISTAQLLPTQLDDDGGAIGAAFLALGS